MARLLSHAAALLCILIPSAALAAEDDFDRRFTGRTLRLDYHHSGDISQERIAVDSVRLEGPWPGSRTQLIDNTDLGRYRVVVLDPESNRPLYSRGFASIYGEWETTAEARDHWGTFHESQRFPEPKSPVQVVIEKRQPDGRFRQIFATMVDPASRFVDRSPVGSVSVRTVLESGPSSTKVDLLFLGDGYTSSELPDWNRTVDGLVAALFAEEPYRSRKADFNVRAIAVTSERSGVSNPRGGFWNRTPLGLSFNALDSDRYMLSVRNRDIREIAAAAPYDALVLVANTRKYGGGGIFNLYSTVAGRSRESAYLFVHEFGHSFAGLADEYYTSSVAYEEFTAPGIEPWEPNVTALLDPDELKWKDLVTPDTPLPTPWNQKAYDEVSLRYQKRRSELRAEGAPEEKLEALFDEIKTKTTPMLRGERFAGKVGAFEGGAYQAKGIYRPEADCIMFTRNTNAYCRVCRRAVESIIDLYAK